MLPAQKPAAEPAPVAGPLPATRQPPVVVVGNGPVGVEFVRRLLARDAGIGVVLYGEEPHEPYDRVALTGFLAGKLSLASLQNGLAPAQRERVVEHYHCRIVEIDRAAHRVRDAAGHWQRYSRLVLATGSRPHEPAIEGIRSPGVFRLRDLRDTERLMARVARSRHTVVLGGGLLGLEAACAMRRMNTRVTVIEHHARLMNRQLDVPAAHQLQTHIERLGVNIMLGDGIKRVIAAPGVSAIALASGRTLECDTLIVATGIVPATELALDAGLAIGRGIRVNDALQTNDPDIYAIGECAEHAGIVHGLVGPGLKQAAIAAENIAGGSARYEGAVTSTRLKVVGMPVASIGPVGEEESPFAFRSIVFEDAAAQTYRRLVVRRGRIAGVQGVGDWPELARIEEAVGNGRRIGPLRRWRFRRSGRLWPQRDANVVQEWPATATVCQCKAVTRGTLSTALASSGCASVECLIAQTGAGGVCGSCRPLLAALVGAAATLVRTPGRKLLVASMTATLLLVALITFAPRIPILPTVQAAIRPEVLWTDPLIKQITGFGLAGVVLIGLVVSARKRIKRVAFGDFAWWRLAHAVAGVLALALLVSHTGLRLGENFNLWLMTVFLAASLTGAATAAITVFERVPTRTTRIARQTVMNMHVWLLWPLPALLGFHILSSYYF